MMRLDKFSYTNIHAVAFSPDGQTLVGAGGRTTIDDLVFWHAPRELGKPESGRRSP
jgi:hypothetical protein